MNIQASPKSDAQTLERLLAARHSCRGFLAEPVADSVIERILAMAQRSPSWCNAQPWQVIVTKGAGTERFRAAIYAHVTKEPSAPDIAFPREYRGTYLARRRGCGFALYDAVGVKRGDRAASAVQMLENYKFFGAPHARGTKSWCRFNPAGGARLPFEVRPRPFRDRRRSSSRLRDFLRLRRPVSCGQRLSH